jgi:hypothetical protein
MRSGTWARLWSAILIRWLSRRRVIYTAKKAWDKFRDRGPDTKDGGDTGARPGGRHAVMMDPGQRSRSL